jgi:hypothetical protein
MFSRGCIGRTFPVLQPKEFVRPSRLLRSNSHSGHEASSLAFSEFLGMTAMIPRLFSPQTLTGTIKGSEKSLDYPNRALDREAYENLRNAHKVDYPLFDAYQNLRLKRGERDLADR